MCSSKQLILHHSFLVLDWLTDDLPSASIGESPDPYMVVWGQQVRHNRRLKYRQWTIKGGDEEGMEEEEEEKTDSQVQPCPSQSYGKILFPLMFYIFFFFI